ncbi:hypothetical protein [Hydrogenophaga sp.]|uniref:hypothetical protein n=1 Tax=Hydrogenophaga sp. TaxID=1904254 RepID=UPI0026057506|nr:hypothetical protein [Hydrogenophaga sp.]
MLAVVDAGDPQGDPIAQPRRLVSTARAADMEGLALHRAIGLVDRVHSTRNAPYFNSVLVHIAGVLLTLLPVARACHCLQHAEVLMARLGVVWPQDAQGLARGTADRSEGDHFLGRKRGR